MKRGENPYKAFGEVLKHIRQDARESLAEVSGAVEIDHDVLERYENGESRPSEDILLLLITHFGVKDSEADKLWNLAGYDQTKTPQINTGDEPIMPTGGVMMIPYDTRIVYTDMVNITVNNFGVVMNFMQNNGPSLQPMQVARVGMSLEHAKSVMDILQQSIDQMTLASQPKQLPSPRAKNNSASDA